MPQSIALNRECPATNPPYNSDVSQTVQCHPCHMQPGTSRLIAVRPPDTSSGHFVMATPQLCWHSNRYLSGRGTRGVVGYQATIKKNGFLSSRQPESIFLDIIFIYMEMILKMLVKRSIVCKIMVTIEK